MANRNTRRNRREWSKVARRAVKAGEAPNFIDAYAEARQPKPAK